MTELEKRNIDYENKENKCELVARLRKNIGEETQREIKGILTIIIYLLPSSIF